MRSILKVWFKQLKQLFCTHQVISFDVIDDRSTFYQCKKCGYCGKLDEE